MRIRKGMVFFRPFANDSGIYGKFIITKTRPLRGYWFEDRGEVYRSGSEVGPTSTIREIIEHNELVLDKSSVIKLFFDEA